MPSPQSTSEGWMLDERHGPLPLLLIVLTVVTGLVDAVSYLKLGHVPLTDATASGVAAATTAALSQFADQLAARADCTPRAS